MTTQEQKILSLFIGKESKALELAKGDIITNMFIEKLKQLKEDEVLALDYDHAALRGKHIKDKSWKKAIAENNLEK